MDYFSFVQNHFVDPVSYMIAETLNRVCKPIFFQRWNLLNYVNHYNSMYIINAVFLKSKLKIKINASIAKCLNVFLGYNNDFFANQTTYIMRPGSSPNSVGIADFDNDTILDIVVANQGTNTLGVLRGYGNGSFACLILFSLNYGSDPFSVIISDVNNVRNLDFIVANEGTDNLNILLQTC